MKTIFNIAHAVLGFFVWNYISHITGFSSYPHNASVLIGITLASLVFGGFAGGGHEWFQAQIDKSNFDKLDILWTALGFLAGAGCAVFYPKFKSELLFDISIVLYYVYWLWISLKLRLSKKPIPGAVKLLLIGLALLLSYVLTSCEKDIVYVPLPQREIPADYMSEKENKIIQLNNEHRQTMGLQPYKTSLDLYHLAKDKALQMRDSDSLSHSGFHERYLSSGALFFGESVAYGFQTPESTLAAYYNSEDHRPMFISPIYEFIATACVGDYNCTLAARYRPYRNSNSRQINQVIEIRTGNISTKQIHP